MHKSVECLLPDATHTLLGSMIPSPSNVLDAVTGVTLPELHQCFCNCSNSLDKDLLQVAEALNVSRPLAM